MLYLNNFKIENEHFFMQVHVPRTGGTALSNQLHGMLGTTRCLRNYRSEIEYLSDAELARLRLISGHFSYGMHSYFSRKPLYLTTVREPIARFISLYLRLLTFPENRHHQVALRYDINDFLHYCLQCDDAELSQQVRNLQCQFVCGHASFSLAKAYIDERYFLACPYDQSEALVSLLSKLLGLNAPPMVIPNATGGLVPRFQDRLNMSDDSCALLLENNSHDLQLFHYVQNVFALVRDEAKSERKVYSPCSNNTIWSDVETNECKNQSLSKLEQLMMNASKRFVQCLPVFLLRTLRGLWLGPHDATTLPDGIKFDFVADVDELKQKNFSEGYFDLILVSLAFETLEYDQLLFNQLHRYMSADGILQICSLNSQRLLDWPDEYQGFSPIRTYQHELLSRFSISEKNLLTLVLKEKFPLTGSRCEVYVFFRSAQYISLIQQCLSSLRPTLSVLCQAIN